MRRSVMEIAVLALVHYSTRTWRVSYQKGELISYSSFFCEITTWLQISCSTSPLLPLTQSQRAFLAVSVGQNIPTLLLYALYVGYFELEMLSVSRVEPMKSDDRRIEGLRMSSMSTRLCARWEFVRSGKRDMKSHTDSISRSKAQESVSRKSTSERGQCVLTFASGVRVS